MLSSHSLQTLHPAALSESQDKCISRAVAIHQPNYLPWLGYFYKLAQTQMFVFLDNVPFSRGSFVNRNVVKGSSSTAWLTIPLRGVNNGRSLISELVSNPIHPWPSQHLRTFQASYGRCPYFQEVYELLEPYYMSVSSGSVGVADFNIRLVSAISKYLGIHTCFVLASTLGVTGAKTDLLVNICRTVGADVYLAGAGGSGYQDDSRFDAAGIRPLCSPFRQRPYKQRFGSFTANLSVVDALMNLGADGARELLDLQNAQARS